MKKTIKTIEKIEVLDKKLKQLQSETDYSVSLNVKTEKGDVISYIDKIEDLIMISASLNSREIAFKKELKRYGLNENKEIVFKESGMTIKDWNVI